MTVTAKPEKTPRGEGSRLYDSDFMLAWHRRYSRAHGNTFHAGSLTGTAIF